VVDSKGKVRNDHPSKKLETKRFNLGPERITGRKRSILDTPALFF